MAQMDGREYMRLLRPLATDASCLRCHGAEEYRVGDVRGGISISVPMEPLRVISRRHVAVLSLGHALVGLVGLQQRLGQPLQQRQPLALLGLRTNLQNPTAIPRPYGGWLALSADWFQTLCPKSQASTDAGRSPFCVWRTRRNR